MTVSSRLLWPVTGARPEGRPCRQDTGPRTGRPPIIFSGDATRRAAGAGTIFCSSVPGITGCCTIWATPFFTNVISLQPARMKAPSTSTPAERLLARRAINPKTGCWEWQGAVLNSGYGQINYAGRTRTVHKFSLETFRGVCPLPKCDVCHTCDNKRCFNPDHLFVGTRRDNVRDCRAKGRISRGEDRHNAKLTANDVVRIRVLASRGFSSQLLACLFPVSPRTIRGIVCGREWSWLPSFFAPRP